MTLFNPDFSRITDEHGRPVSGGLAYFYKSGAVPTLQAVYADNALLNPHTNPVVADAEGLLPAIYLNDALTYAVEFRDASSDTLRTADPVNKSNATGSPVDTVSAANYAVQPSDANRLKKRTAAGAMADTLPTGLSAGNGFRVTIWNATTLYADTVSVASSGTINGAASFAILPGQWVTFISDGANWVAQPAPLMTGLREYAIEGGGLIPRTTDGATYSKYETATNKRNFDSYLFAVGAQKYCDFTLPLPPSYGGGPIQAIVEWTDTGATAAQTCTFGVAGRCLADGDVLDQALGTAAEQADAVDAPGDAMKTPAFNFTPANAGSGRLLTGTLYRKASTGTITGDVRVLSLRLLVPLNGSVDG